MRLERETGAHVAFINLSGGVGIPYLPEQQANDIHAIGEGVHAAYDEILVPAGMGDVAICTEMGRFMMGPYGCLVTKAIHEKQIYKDYIGVDASAVDLIRPAMYGAYHHITVMGQPGGSDKTAAPVTNTYDITGNLCENNDKFAIDRELPQIDMGDVLVIHDTGAHGHSMGYNYNGRLRSAEVLLRPDGSADLIRRAERAAGKVTRRKRPSSRPGRTPGRRRPMEQTHPDRRSEGEEYGCPQPRGLYRRPRHTI